MWQFFLKHSYLLEMHVEMFMNEIIWSLSLVLKQRGKGENGLGYRSQRVRHNWATELNWTDRFKSTGSELIITEV